MRRDTPLHYWKDKNKRTEDNHREVKRYLDMLYENECKKNIYILRWVSIAEKITNKLEYLYFTKGTSIKQLMEVYWNEIEKYNINKNFYKINMW